MLKSLLFIIIIVSLASCAKVEDAKKKLAEIEQNNNKPEDPEPETRYCSKNYVKIQWAIPDTRESGNLLEVSELNSYTVYWGTASREKVGSYSDSLVIPNPNTRSFFVENLDPSEQYYFAMTATDDAGNTSTYSEEVFIDLSKNLCKSKVEQRKPSNPRPIDITCSEKVKITYQWSLLDNAHYRLLTGTKRATPDSMTELYKGMDTYEIEVKRGRNAYAVLEAFNRGKKINYSKEYQTKVFTCRELQIVKDRNPDYQENFNININWSKDEI